MNHSVIKLGVVGKFKIETPKNIWIDEFICSVSKAWSFKWIDENTNKLKCISESQSKHNKFGDYKKRLDAEIYQKECDIYFLRSHDNEMYLQKLKKTDFIYFRW